jgi:hypothetical protein
MLSMVVHACLPRNSGKITVQPSLGKKQDPIFKITRAKMARDVVQMVECLSNKHKALNSNSGTTK